MSFNLPVRVVRATWIPLFIIGCGLFILHRADSEFSGFVPPQLHKPHYIMLGMFAQCVVWISLAAGWQSLVQRTGGENYLRLKSAFWHLALFSVGKYLPGKVWGFLARGSSMAREGINTGASLGASILEQIIVFHSGYIVLAATSIALLPIYPWLILMIVAILSLFTVQNIYAIALKALYFGLSKLLKLVRFDSMQHKTRKPELKVLWLYVLVWLGHGAIFLCLFLATSESGIHLSVQLIALFFLANTVGMLAGFVAFFAPAGFGVREAGAALVLSSSMSINEAILLAALMRVWSISSDVFLLLLALGVRNSRMRGV
ncbi:MAG: hypothetical protein U0989_16565 [Azonexus sp.]|nr:hypothetical protein [Azonexus sp.]